jgi:hypothetical protein
VFIDASRTTRSSLRSRLAVLVGSLVLVACGGGGGDTAQPAAPAAPATPTTLSDEQATLLAMGLWRNGDLRQHPKGSCAGCHGADFIDLAAIGSTTSDIRRRALIDGATAAQADALAQAVAAQRRRLNLPTRDARSFRPFQPGGAVLEPSLDGPRWLNAVQRDAAFARQISALLPTLMGPRIETLEQARQARAEILDIAYGTNTAGANPARLNLRRLPTGITYPLWSADRHHGAAEGTLNDWTADIAHDAPPERREAWLALQDAYLANPGNDSFWRMYFAADAHLQMPLLGACTLSCGGVQDFNEHKFRAALIGQHLLRLQALGRDAEEFFGGGALAFRYLDNHPEFGAAHLARFQGRLPADLWEIGDRGRVILESSQAAGSFADNLLKLGFPSFVRDSIDPLRSAGQEDQDLRLAWFWIGFTMEPSFARIHGSNATKVGEYMVATLLAERMFVHNAFHTTVRLVMSAQPEARAARSGGRIVDGSARYLMHYSYFIGYGREVIDTEWQESTRDGIRIPAELRAEVEGHFGRFTTNSYRMSLLLQKHDVEAGRLSSAELTQLQSILASAQGQTAGAAHPIVRAFRHYAAASATADEALFEATRAAVVVAQR